MNSRILKISNVFLFLIQIFTLIFLLIIALARSQYEPLSETMYPSSAYLMNSMFLDWYMTSGTAIAMGVFSIASIAKEFYLPSLKIRLIANGALVIASQLFAGLIVYLIYAPAFD